MNWIALYVCGALVSWYVIAGMYFAEEQGSFPSIARDIPRSSYGYSVVIGCLYALMWPVGLPLAWCLTGFAQYGMWRAHGEDALETR